ncbi:bifunctional folylpolyglutamate synthase/dihydrofolate synthase, partial [Francisella tularensis subsp. holarctica]|nr:bifunctional folylpolyglutamate synthase/dihydrofolate synthase [Francisella tularensis subsp. holarctica]
DIHYREAVLSMLNQQFKLLQLLRLDYIIDLIIVYLAKIDNLTVVFGSFVIAGELIRNYENYTSK